jgi:RHS repeat-associated protein
LVGIASKLGATTIQNLSQTLNANGQVATTTDATGTTTYTHDPDGRLVAVSGPGSASQSYIYDAAGNRISGPLSTSSTYNAADELTSDTGFNYTYDAEGQRTSRVDRSTGATTRYTYDGAKRLTSIQFPDGTTTTYTYDPLGRRLTVTAGGTTTGYVYDGVNARLEYGSSGLTASYVGAGQVDQPLEMSRGGSAYYYLQNFQGSVTDLTNSTGSVAASYSYDAYGVPTSSPATVANPFTFTGREYDAKSGLYYNRARYYDPTTGSFTSQDSVSSGQRYGYAGGDPVDFTDPSGALFAEIASLYARATAQASRMKLIGCGLAVYSAVIEIELNVAARQKLNWASFVAMGAGVVTACAVGYLGGATNGFRSLIGLPLAAALVAGLVDLALEAICASQTNNWSGIHPEHVISIGLAAFAIGAGAAVLPALLPAAAPLESQFEVALGGAILSGDAAGVADLSLGGGACG